LALMAAIALVRRYRTRRAGLFLLSFGATAFMLSFGLNLALGSWKLWPLLGQIVPPLDSARSLFRFAYFSQLVILLLATFGASIAVRQLRKLATRRASLMWNWANKGPGTNKRSARIVAIAATVFFGGVLVLETPPPGLRLIGVPDSRIDRDWIAVLKEKEAGEPIVCLPFTEGLSESGLESTARWMLLATRHGRPLLNGYSGFFPASWYANVDRFQAESWTEELARFLYDSGVLTIVVDTETNSGLSLPGEYVPLGEYELSRVFAGQDGVAIWSLSRRRNYSDGEGGTP
jgi:hypothetical protein